MKKLEDFLKRNLSAEPYRSVRCAITDDYPEIKINLSKVPENIINWAKRDMELFSVIQKNRNRINSPLEGDYILRKNGKLTKIGIYVNNKMIQDTEGGSFYMCQHGTCSFSGGFTGDILKVSDLQDTGETKPLLCWTFSGDFAGANRGVYEYLNTRIWKEI